MSGGKNEAGGQSRDRTDDTRIFSPLLYQLSYLAPCEKGILGFFRSMSTLRAPMLAA